MTPYEERRLLRSMTLDAWFDDESRRTPQTTAGPDAMRCTSSHREKGMPRLPWWAYALIGLVVLTVCAWFGVYVADRADAASARGPVAGMDAARMGAVVRAEASRGGFR